MADLDHSPLADTMKKMPLAGALIDMFQAAEVAPEAPCRLAVEVEVEGAALVPDERVVEGIRMLLVAAGEAEETEETEEVTVLHEQTHRDSRRPRRNWTPRWRTTSTPTAVPRSLLRKLLLRPAERLLHPLTLMTLT